MLYYTLPPILSNSPCKMPRFRNHVQKEFGVIQEGWPPAFVDLRPLFNPEQGSLGNPCRSVHHKVSQFKIPALLLCHVCFYSDWRLCIMMLVDLPSNVTLMLRAGICRALRHVTCVFRLRLRGGRHVGWFYFPMKMVFLLQMSRWRCCSCCC